jgi:hypothetical protein
MGRFNFTLIGAHGRITGVVAIPTENKTREEIEVEAHRKITRLDCPAATAISER